MAQRYAFVEVEAPRPAPTRYGSVGWAPFAPLATPNVQRGAYDETRLNFLPGAWPGIQLYGGVAGLDPQWVVASTSDRPIWQQSQYPGAADQTQRYGSAFSGPIGPIAAQALAQRVTDGQVRQSSVQAIDWASALYGR